ncbi:uncharacterized protein LOC122280563 [Carya illinoinensis]|uniref:uncharacterized protein LOC122280563 n=1 Tax=Carya illinoinensis TaxID=32201 RepID=UPI001C723446|nr:uncharacterized protein LOC122280563 [Carya illinoinensis]
MGEEEDAMAPRPSMSTSQSFLTPQNTHESPNIFTYPLSSSNPEDFRHELSEFSTFEENARCTFSDQADEMLFDLDDDIEGTPVVLDDLVQVEAPTSGMKFGSEKDLMAYYKQYANKRDFV